MIPFSGWRIAGEALALLTRQTGVPSDAQVATAATANPALLAVLVPTLASVLTALGTVWWTSRQKREEAVTATEQTRWTELRADYRDSRKQADHYRTRYLVEKEQHGITKVELTRAQMENAHLRRLLEGEDDDARPER